MGGFRGLLLSEEKTLKDNGVARPPSHKCTRRVGAVTGTWSTTRGLLYPTRLFTGDVRQKAQKEQTKGGTTGSGCS